MELVKLTETILKEIVDDPESITVKEFPSDDEKCINIEVMIPEDQMGKVIGRQGKLANALRVVVNASSYINYNKRANVNIDSY